MNLTTLEQSKQLQKWGAPQDTGWFWVSPTPHHGNPEWRLIDCEDTHANENIAAYDLESILFWIRQGLDIIYVSSTKDSYFEPVWEAGNVIGKERHRGNTALEAVFSLAEAMKGSHGE